MHRTLAALAALAAATPTAAQPQDKPPWRALTDSVKAAEIVLRDVCLPGIADGRPIAELARFEHLVAMPSKAANAGPNDKVFRIGSLGHVQAVAWADGSCSTYVDRGPADELRAMAERVILARPEGFARGRSGPEAGGRVERTVYCAAHGNAWLVATVTTPAGRSGGGTRALSSTVYRRTSPSPLCTP